LARNHLHRHPAPGAPRHDLTKDFTPIAGLVSIDHALLNPSMLTNSVKELIASQSQVGQLNYGDYGVGSSGHLKYDVQGGDRIELRRRALQGRDAGRKTSWPATSIDFISTGSAMPQAKAGTVKIIGLGAESAWRSADAGDRRDRAGHGGIMVRPVRPGARRPMWLQNQRRVRAIFADPKVRGTFSTRNISKRCRLAR
jgi:tripartite-type tricarboxylate transporter receptor subunit TctC